MIVTLIGSSRFETDFVEANRELTLRGHVVISLGVMPRDAPKREWYRPSQKVILDMVHLQKILEAQAVLLLGDGYVGESTIREVTWAHVLGKHVVPLWAFAGLAAGVNWEGIHGNLGNSKRRWTATLSKRCAELLDSGLTSGSIRG